MSRILLPPSKLEITKVVSAGTNTMVIPLTIPGMLNGSRNAEQDLKKVGSQVLGGIDDVVIDLGQYIINRKNHKWQEVVYHAENNGSRCVD